MEAVAQGRVWSGTRAVAKGLVDAVGGLHEAVALAKQAAGIAQDERVSVVEVSRASTSPLALLAGGGASATTAAALLGGVAAALAQGASPAAALQGAVGLAAMQQQLGVSAAGGPAAVLALLQGLQQGAVMAFDFDAASLAQGGAVPPAVAAGGSSGSASLFEEGGGEGGLTGAADAALAAVEEWLL